MDESANIHVALVNKCRTHVLNFLSDSSKEQLKVGIIEETPVDCVVTECFYLPYHPKFWDDKTTSKLRIVFDSSARRPQPKRLLV